MPKSNAVVPQNIVAITGEFQFDKITDEDYQQIVEWQETVYRAQLHLHQAVERIKNRLDIGAIAAGKKYGWDEEIERVKERWEIAQDAKERAKRERTRN